MLMTTNEPAAAPYDPAFQQPHYALPQQLPPAAPAGARRGRRGRLAVAGAAVVAAATVGGLAVGNAGSATIAGSGSSARLLPSIQGNGPGGNGSGTGRSRTGTSTSVALATTAQQKGIVTIVSVLKYQNAESAGTGMILTSNGEILTNNHVINGATSVTVTVETSGRSYRADVVGTDAPDDVAVLQLRNASGLTTAKVGNAANVAVGNSIVGVGNAGGTGTLRASSGKVTALNQSIKASDESGQGGETLHGLIEVDAQIISGDSGGPMYDSSGEIIGMNTAASAARSAASTAYAIPIDNAVSIADQIESGVETSNIQLGLPAFLGVGVAEAGGSGASVTSVLRGGPAADAGITSGSVITSVGGKKVTSPTSLKRVLSGYRPGTGVTIDWTAADGSAHSATVTPVSGPAA